MLATSYLCPVVSAPIDDTSPWYVSVAIGKNYLSRMMKSMCEAAGIPGNKTNRRNSNDKTNGTI